MSANNASSSASNGAASTAKQRAGKHTSSSNLSVPGSSSSSSLSADPKDKDCIDEIANRSTSPAQQAQQEVNESSWHFLMWIPLALLCPAAVFSTQFIVDMVNERNEHMHAHPEIYTWAYPSLSDLRITGVALVVLLVLRFVLCRFVFTPFGDWVLPTCEEKKGKWTTAAREDRVQRFSVCGFKLCYFTFITVVGYYTLRDCSWLPPQLFGSGEVKEVWTDWPYQEVSDGVKWYYLVELSYHAHSLILHLFTVHRNDFVEMTLHHTCAILLVVFSFYANFIRIGSLVLFLHDIADVMAYAVKTCVDTKYTILTLLTYAGLLISWGYTRLYVFPAHVIYGAIIPGEDNRGLVWMTSWAMVWLLQLLHIYWYILFLIMGYRFLVSGKTMDIQQKAGEQDGSYVDYHKRKLSDETNGGGAHAPSSGKKSAAAAAAASSVSDDSSSNSHSPSGDDEGDDDELSPVKIKPTAVRTRSQKKGSRRAD